MRRAFENGGRHRDVEARHEPAPTGVARLDDIADGEPTEDTLRTREDHACYVAVLLELDEPENEELLARLQTVDFGC
ncbi:MAG: hypothetical protein M3289_04170 [Actinomycetota bacterium]|nr:hypothetical protein [Actinomycetota bacterium]